MPIKPTEQIALTENDAEAMPQFILQPDYNYSQFLVPERAVGLLHVVPVEALDVVAEDGAVAVLEVRLRTIHI